MIGSGGYNGPGSGFVTNQNSYTGGNMWLFSSNPGSTWASFPGNNLLREAAFVTAATGTLEPGTWLLLGGGPAGLALRRRWAL